MREHTAKEKFFPSFALTVGHDTQSPVAAPDEESPVIVGKAETRDGR